MKRIACAPPSGCVTCGVEIKPSRTTCGVICRKKLEIKHFWLRARHEALLRAKGLCVRCGKDASEVNHITPLNGGLRWLTCLNHQENLEALCHTCHLDFTYPSRVARRKDAAIHPTFQGFDEVRAPAGAVESGMIS